jgi:hypothetical protein
MEMQPNGSLVEDLRIPTLHGCKYNTAKMLRNCQADETCRLRNAEWPDICIQLVHGWAENGYVFASDIELPATGRLTDL